MQEYNICYSLDSAYVEQLAVSIASILKNADVNENINFYILDGGLTKKDKKEIESLKNIKNFNIEYLSVNSSDFSDYPLLKKDNIDYKNYHVTLPTYFRFKLPALLNSLSKVLYLDCDVIINDSLKGIFDTNIDNYAVAMVLDADSTKESKRLGLKKYFNAGVMLLNLDFWREHNLELQLLDYAKKNKSKILWQDQDIVNSVLFENIKELPNIWNYQYLQYEKVDANKLAKTIIFHLAGRFKPWLIPFEHFVYDLYYYYLDFTPFRNKIIEYKQKSSGKFLKDDIGGSTTNIRLLATDEDIQKIYSEISAAYEFMKGQVVLLNANSDNKTSKVYEELSKNYDFTKESDEKLQEQLNNNFDEKIGKVYEEISKNYDYTKESDARLQEQLNNNVDEKIGKVYEEISKNYDYTKENDERLQEQLNNNVDEKIGKVYEEISKNYDYTKESDERLQEQLNNNIDEKVGKVYEEISKNYDFIKEKEERLQEQLNNNIDEKVGKVYEEISKNYAYTKESDEKLQEQLTNNVDEKIGKVYEEISKNYDYTKESDEKLQEQLNNNVDEKIGKVYEEISKNYDYTKENDERLQENLNNNVNEKISNVYEEISSIQNKLNIIKSENDEKINIFEIAVSNKINESELNIRNDIKNIEKNIYEEITKNNSYTEYLVQTVEEKQNQKRIETLNEIKSSINILETNVDSKLNTEINSLKLLTEDKVKVLEELFYSENKVLEAKISKENNHKISELYSYTNENYSKLYKEINDSHYKLENIINDRIYNLNSNHEKLKGEINYLKESIEKKISYETIKSVLTDMENKLTEQKAEYDKNIFKLQTDFDEKINQQRIKYENKLINMENQIAQMRIEINEHKKGIFQKLIQKLKKSKKR